MHCDALWFIHLYPTYPNNSLFIGITAIKRKKPVDAVVPGEDQPGKYGER